MGKGGAKGLFALWGKHEDARTVSFVRDFDPPGRVPVLQLWGFTPIFLVTEPLFPEASGFER